MIKTESEKRLNKRFNTELKEFRKSSKLLREENAKKLLSIIEPLCTSKKGIKFLYDKAIELEEAGLFIDTVWEEPKNLAASLAGGTLKMQHPSSTYEIMSELRMLKYLELPDDEIPVSKEFINDFLEQLIVSNLKLIFSPSDEELRENLTENDLLKIKNLFDLILEKLSFENIKDQLAEEVEMICMQRPIMVTHVKEILKLVKDKVKLDSSNASDKKLLKYINALDCPTKSIFECKSKKEYQEFLKNADYEQLFKEAKQLGHSMRETGLVCPNHALFLKHIYKSNTKLLDKVLSLDNAGKAELNTNMEFIQTLIEKAIIPETSQSIYGLSELINRGLISRKPVKNGIQKSFNLKLHPNVKERLSHLESYKNNIEQNTLLTAGIISVLGQPLGIGQGLNPTCQAARGISLWSQHAPGKLLNMIINAAEQDNLEFYFEGNIIQSDTLPQGLAPELDYNLDVVSIILVPHLDKIYNEMMKRASYRGEDPHKWVNPALYGQWIQTGFYSAYDHTLNAVNNYEDFARTFYSSFHPEYNGGHDLIYPNPVGIFITTATGKLLGFHAISLLRVAKSPDGEYRAYFLNPNNEGRQNWGQEIKPTVYGNGEEHGESSLPFYQFVSRLYAYHYNRLSLGDKSLVNDEEINNIIKLSKESWGKSYNWIKQKNYYG